MNCRTGLEYGDRSYYSCVALDRGNPGCTIAAVANPARFGNASIDAQTYVFCGWSGVEVAGHSASDALVMHHSVVGE
jgi:hypothetical protein